MNRVKFGDVVQEIKINVDRTTDDHEYFIAGEHMDSSNIHITRRGRFSESDVGPAFIRLFRPGQVLYGSRRTYLRKVAVADFEGITSNTTFVLETKDSNRLLQELLPYIMLTDRFSEYAINNSKGSTNPYILFKDLAAYEFDLPTIEEQRQLVVLLSACDRAKEAYKRLLKQTDEVVKSQFIEQFVLDKSHPREQLRGNIVEMFIGPFGSALKNDCFVEESNAYCMVYEQKHAIQKSMDLPTRYVDEKKFRELARFNIQPGDVIVSCRGTIGEVFVVPDNAPMGIMHPSIMKVRLNRKRYNNVFFAMLLEHYMEEHKQEANGTGVKMAVSASTLEKECFVIPEKSIQDAFVAFAEQSDKSKFVDLQTTISELYTCRIKSLSIYGGQCYAE